MAGAIIAAAVSVLIFGIGYLTEGRRARRRRLDDEALSGAIAFLAASSKRRRQLGVLSSMARRDSLAGKDIFRLDPPPEDIADALKRYALILDQYGEAEARVRFLLPPALHQQIGELNEKHSELRELIGQPGFQQCADELAAAMGDWTDRAEAYLRGPKLVRAPIGR
ncbi:hypothetical protein KOI35_32910 [Actinoplanes bogorensis]|uniref:Uncharacterized protein n=1 Tax=Paractinoplanes bogorensis TaxID=1610840 RepID=A0ABS5YY03_9ACTN|nr:hypothetical protein [Actinoplanes bogorensis]MBU2668324.1 hypothetical protein [Actinoplanes bogorensis]